jgi:hypothetical protein
MSERFRAVDQETPYLLPPSVQDWLSEPHLARFVVDVVSKPMLQHHCQVLIVCLHVLYGYDEQYKLEKLPELGELIRKVSGIEIARNRRRPGFSGRSRAGQAGSLYRDPCRARAGRLG